jgi:vacuolar-type H+-ATPase catalytic subunit A/Vma1
MKKEDVIYSRKEFLNLAGLESTAGIVAHITNETWSGEDKLKRDVDIVLDISDCSRKISLALSVYDEYDRDNAINKLDTLIDVLTEFREAVSKECNIQDKLKKARDKKKK